MLNIANIATVISSATVVQNARRPPKTKIVAAVKHSNAAGYTVVKRCSDLPGEFRYVTCVR